MEKKKIPRRGFKQPITKSLEKYPCHPNCKKSLDDLRLMAKVFADKTTRHLFLKKTYLYGKDPDKWLKQLMSDSTVQKKLVASEEIGCESDSDNPKNLKPKTGRGALSTRGGRGGKITGFARGGHAGPSRGGHSGPPRGGHSGPPRGRPFGPPRGGHSGPPRGGHSGPSRGGPPDDDFKQQCHRLISNIGNFGATGIAGMLPLGLPRSALERPEEEEVFHDQPGPSRFEGRQPRPEDRRNPDYRGPSPHGPPRIDDPLKEQYERLLSNVNKIGGFGNLNLNLPVPNIPSDSSGMPGPSAQKRKGFCEQRMEPKRSRFAEESDPNPPRSAEMQRGPSGDRGSPKKEYPPHPNCRMSKGALTQMSKMLSGKKRRSTFFSLVYRYGEDPDKLMKKLLMEEMHEGQGTKPSSGGGSAAQKPPFGRNRPAPSKQVNSGPRDGGPNGGPPGNMPLHNNSGPPGNMPPFNSGPPGNKPHHNNSGSPGNMPPFNSGPPGNMPLHNNSGPPGNMPPFSNGPPGIVPQLNSGNVPFNNCPPGSMQSFNNGPPSMLLFNNCPPGPMPTYGHPGDMPPFSYGPAGHVLPFNNGPPSVMPQLNHGLPGNMLPFNDGTLIYMQPINQGLPGNVAPFNSGPPSNVPPFNNQIQGGMDRQSNMPLDIQKPSGRQPSIEKQQPSGTDKLEQGDPTVPMFIVPARYPSESFSDQEMDAIENAILDAILEIGDERLKPTFQDSFRDNGRYGVICNDQMSKKWLFSFLTRCRPWPSASFKVIYAEPPKVKAFAKFPLCRNDDDYKILTFIAKQNTKFNVNHWEVVRRLDSDSSTSLILKIDEESAKLLKDDRKVNFKMGRAEIIVEEGYKGDENSSGGSDRKEITERDFDPGGRASSSDREVEEPPPWSSLVRQDPTSRKKNLSKYGEPSRKGLEDRFSLTRTSPGIEQPSRFDGPSQAPFSRPTRSNRYFTVSPEPSQSSRFARSPSPEPMVRQTHDFGERSRQGTRIPYSSGHIERDQSTFDHLIPMVDYNRDTRMGGPLRSLTMDPGSVGNRIPTIGESRRDRRSRDNSNADQRFSQPSSSRSNYTKFPERR